MNSEPDGQPYKLAQNPFHAVPHSQSGDVHLAHATHTITAKANSIMKKRRADIDFEPITTPSVAQVPVRQVHMQVELDDGVGRTRERITDPLSVKEWVHERGFSSAHAMPAILRPGNLIELYPMLQCDPAYVAATQPRIDVKFEVVSVIGAGPGIDQEEAVPLLH